MDDLTSLVTRLEERQITRREFVKRAAALGLSLPTVSAIAAACAAPPTPEPTPEAEAPSPTPAGVEQVNLGVLYPRTGDYARLGETCIEASILAAEDINDAGGIEALGGARINLIISDATSEATQARSQAERLLTQNELAAATGCYSSSLTLVATEVSERLGIPWITGSISNALTERGFKYFFQVSPKATMFGQYQVETAKRLGEKTGENKVAIVYEDTSYGTNTSEGLRDTAEKLGFDIVLYEAYSAGFTDAAPLVNKIKASGAEILFPVSYLTDAILIIKAMRDLNVNAAVIGGGAGYLMPEFYKSLGSAAEHTLSVASWNLDIACPGVPEFAAAYEGRFGEFLQEHAGEAYVMMWVMKEALENAASTDPKKVRDAMAGLDLTEGLASAMPGCHVQFDEDGWNQHVHPVMIQWRDGRPKTIWPPEDARVEPVWPIPSWEERA